MVKKKHPIDYWQYFRKYIWLMFSFCQNQWNTYRWDILNIQNILLSSSIVPWLMLESRADISENFQRRRRIALVQEHCHIHMEIPRSNPPTIVQKALHIWIYIRLQIVQYVKSFWTARRQQNFASLCNVAWEDFIYQTFYSHTNNIKLMFGILRSRSRNRINICKYMSYNMSYNMVIKCLKKFSES